MFPHRNVIIQVHTIIITLLVDLFVTNIDLNEMCTKFFSYSYRVHYVVEVHKFKVSQDEAPYYCICTRISRNLIYLVNSIYVSFLYLLVNTCSFIFTLLFKYVQLFNIFPRAPVIVLFLRSFEKFACNGASSWTAAFFDVFRYRPPRRLFNFKLGIGTLCG